MPAWVEPTRQSGCCTNPDTHRRFVNRDCALSPSPSEPQDLLPRLSPRRRSSHRCHSPSAGAGLPLILSGNFRYSRGKLGLQPRDACWPKADVQQSPLSGSATFSSVSSRPIVTIAPGSGQCRLGFDPKKRCDPMASRPLARLDAALKAIRSVQRTRRCLPAL